MASNVSTQKLVNELQSAVKSGEELLKVMKETNDVIIDTAKVLKVAFDGIDKESSKGLAEFNKLLKQTNELTKEQEKLTVSITKAEKEQKDNILELSKIRTATNKNLKEEEGLRQQKIKTGIIERKEQERLLVQDEKNRKAKERLNSAYAQESKRLNDLRKKYKDLVVSEGKVTKESRKLLKEIKSLDRELKDLDASAGQFQRNVGDYPDTLGKALGSVTKLAAGVLALGGALKGVETGLNSTEEGSEDLRKATGAFDTAMDQAKSTMGTFLLESIELGKKLIDNAKDVNGLDDAIDNVANGYDKTSEKLTNFTGDLKKNTDANDEAIEKTIQLEKALRPLNERLSELNGIFDIQNAIAGDSTRSFDEIELAANRAANASLERSQILQQIAQEELDIITKLIDSKTKEFNKRALLDQQSEATIKLQETKNAVDVEQLEIQKLLSENTRDRFERELDFAIDAFDTIKTVNERIIADERTSLDVRRALFEETTLLTEKSFESQKALFAEFVSDKIDFDTLVLESDEAIIRSTLRRLDLDDVELGRALEVIRERKISVQDLVEANNDLIESEQERLDLQRDIEASDIAIVKRTIEASEDLEDDRIDIQLQGIEDRLKNLDVGSVEELRLLKEKNDLILQQQEKQLEEEAELRDKAAEDKEVSDQEDLDAEAEKLDKRKKLLEDASTVFEQILSRAREKEGAALDAEIDSIDSRIQTIRDAIDSGNSEASQSLAQLEKQKIEAEKKREELRKKEIRDAKIIAGLQLLAANSSEPNAVGKTLGDVSLLLAALSQLPSFFDGIEDTGTVNNALDNNGGRHVVLHDNERVMTAKQNAKLGGISNEDLADLGAMHNSGSINGGTTIIQNNNKELVTEMREVVKSIKAQPQHSYNFDERGKYHTEIVKSLNKTLKIKSKPNNLFK